MYVEQDFFIGLGDIDFKNNLKIKSLLGYFEDIGGIHSNKVGYGLLDIPVKKRSWVLIAWKVKIIKRPHYSEVLRIKTWSCAIQKLYAIREFEVYNESGEKVAIASSKWVCVDTDKMSIAKIDDNIINAYESEEPRVFDDEIQKLKDPGSYIDSCTIHITKDLIDVNKHVHNLNYIDFATQLFPYEVMQNAQNIEVMYKKEIKENDNIKCFYSVKENEHYVVIKSEDEKFIHAIIKII